MMSKIFQCFSIILLWVVASSYANYCTGRSANKCCEYGGSGQNTCPGYGTSGVADFFGYVFQGRTQKLIAGIYGGLFYIYDFYYQFQPGAQAIGRFLTLYGYCLQIPKKNSTKSFKLYCFEVVSCVTFVEVTQYKSGYFRGTDLAYSIIYEVVKSYIPSSSCSQCQVLFGHSDPDNSGLSTSALRPSLIAYMSGMNAFRYYKLPHKKDVCTCACVDPKKVGSYFEIESGYCANTYVEKRYPVSGRHYSCNNPIRKLEIGQELAAIKYDFDQLYNARARCAFSQLLGLILGREPLTYFRPIKFSFLSAPYACFYQIDVEFQADQSYQATRPFFEAMC